MYFPNKPSGFLGGTAAFAGIFRVVLVLVSSLHFLRLPRRLLVLGLLALLNCKGRFRPTSHSGGPLLIELDSQMETFVHNVIHNLFQPLLLFFYMGFLIPLLKVPFEFPKVLYQGLTIYLLVAIGWHGGEELAGLGARRIRGSGRIHGDRFLHQLHHRHRRLPDAAERHEIAAGGRRNCCRVLWIPTRPGRSSPVWAC